MYIKHSLGTCIVKLWVHLTCSIGIFYFVLQLPEDCRLAAVFVAGLSLTGTISELVCPFYFLICCIPSYFVLLTEFNGRRW